MRITVLEWSLSGQSREVTDRFVAPLEAAGHTITRVQLQNEGDYPFPWTPVQFFGLFPEVVRLEAPAARPLELGEADLVVASGSVWYLRPCQPWQSFLQGPQADWLKGKRVVALLTCRNMWVTGCGIWVQQLRDAGARVTDRIVVTHSGPVFASFYTTLIWSVTGKREVSKVLPKVEIDADTLARVQSFSETLAERLPEGDLNDLETSPISHAHAFGEMTVGATLFPVLAGVYATLSSPGSGLRAVFAVFQMVFMLSLVTTLGLPFLLTHLLFRRWIDPWVESRAALG